MFEGRRDLGKKMNVEKNIVVGWGVSERNRRGI